VDVRLGEALRAAIEHVSNSPEADVHNIKAMSLALAELAFQ
jgi:hypothetical protein